ncbi:DNA repair protein RadA [Tessaracoccus sp.]
MAAPKTSYKCSDCGWTAIKWVGRCGGTCKGWGTVVEVEGAVTKSTGVRSKMVAGTVARPAQRVGEVSAMSAKHRPTGIGELDRVLGGGFVDGSAILIAGEPGAGKSTMLMSVANACAASGRTALIVSGEESIGQLKARAIRIGANDDDLFLAAESDLSVVLGQIEQVQPDLLVVDSLQTMSSPEVDGRQAGVAQVTEVATVLVRVAKSTGMVLVLVNQLTKNNDLAGPRTVEHLVDAVAVLEGDKHSTLRMLRCSKNRYGDADEVGCFEHTENGLMEVPDPSGLFMGSREAADVPGVCVTVTIEGKRAIPAEVQALVMASALPIPRRGQSGLDTARVAMIQAVVERHGRVTLSNKDVYTATVGGMKLTEPAADLALAMAMASAALDLTIPRDVVVLGEVALSGDIRRVPSVGRRLAEASRMGFRLAIVPPGAKADLPKGVSMTVVEVAHIGRAFAALRALPQSGRVDDDGLAALAS